MASSLHFSDSPGSPESPAAFKSPEAPFFKVSRPPVSGRRSLETAARFRLGQPSPLVTTALRRLPDLAARL